MGKLYLEGKGIIKLNGKPITEYIFSEDEEIVLEFLPFLSYGIKSVPYAVSIAIESGEPVIESELIKCIRWGEDYELRFLPMVIDTYEPPEAMTQNAVYTENGDVIVTVYKDTRTRVVIEGPSMFYIHTPEIIITEPEIRMNQAQDKIVVALTAKAENKTYLLIIMISKTVRILYEDIADNITYNQNNIKVTKRLEDMKGRVLTRTLTYNGTKYEEISRTYEYSVNHEYKQPLIPYALLEAIMAEDTDDAAKYLDSTLDVKAMKQFFGDIEEITEPKYNDYGENCVAVINRSDKNLIASIYRFTFTGDLINNIIEL